MISLLNISSKSSSIKRKAIKRNKKISWENKTSGASYSVPRKIIIKRPPVVKQKFVSRYDIRPQPITYSQLVEYEMAIRINKEATCSEDIISTPLIDEYKLRKELGDSLYVRRGELIRELCSLYKASRKVCFMASVNMLKHWLSCYRVADTKRFLANHI